MNRSEELWSKVVKRVSPAMQEFVPDLRSFLATLDNPHARHLSGYPNIEPCNLASATRLEASVVEHVSNGKISKIMGAEWLRFIFSAIRVFNDAGAQLTPTHRPLVSPPEPSPFGPKFGQQVEKVEIWRQALYQWISCTDSKSCAEDWLGAICTSAAVHGMLVDDIRLKIFISQLAVGTSPLVASGATSVLFSLPFRGLGNHHNIRWYLDPVTEMLVWRYLRCKFPPVDTPIHTMLATFLADNGCPRGRRAQSLRALVGATTAWWLMHADPVEVYCAGRQITSHSIQNRSFSRLFGVKSLHSDDFANSDVQSDPGIRHQSLEADAFLSDDVTLLYPWFSDAQTALGHALVSEVSNGISDLMDTWKTDSLAQVYLGWLTFLLKGRSSTGKGLNLSTIQRRFLAATPRLLATIGNANPREMEVSTLEDVYGELLTDPDPSVPVLDTGYGLRDFHFYLHETFGTPLISDEAEVLGEKVALRPVDANLMSPDDYESAMAIIDSDLHIQSDSDREACKIVLMFAFKGGARRMEIFGLRLSDIQTAIGIDALIRPHSSRRLKTDSSQRRLPMHAFLNSRDRRLLVEFHRRRTKLCHANQHLGMDPNYLFEEFGTPRQQSWIDKVVSHVMRAIREATGDDLLVLHHLRHSFATWTYLSLRASDVPWISSQFRSLPATALWIKRSRRLRLFLYGRDPQGTRTFAHAVSRLLGHSSPRMSFAHYIHSSDIVQAGLAYRLCEQVPSEVLRSCSGLQRSAGFDHLGKSLNALLDGSRNQFAPSELITLPKSKSGRKPGRPKKVARHLDSTWITAKRVMIILDYSITHNMESEKIALRLGVTQAIVEVILKSASRWGPSIGLEVHSAGQIASCPTSPRGGQAQNFCIAFEAAIAALHTRNPALCNEGLQICLEHYSADKHDITFRGEKDSASITRFFRFMDALGATAGEYSYAVI